MILLPRPVDIKFRISSPFGKPRVINGREGVHRGVDFATPVGSDVFAIAGGPVFKAGWQNPDNHEEGFGFRIWQKVEVEDTKCDLFYGHLSEIFCQEGKYTGSGQKIALTGNTGGASTGGPSTGPHIHIGLRKEATGEWLAITFKEV